MTKYDYIPTEFGRAWVASRTEARRGIYTPLSYIDINEGNRFDGDVFAQIMYWHEPNIETGESRLTRQKDGNFWLTKNHADWFKETRIKLQTVRKCLDRLKKRNLIVYELGGEKGNVTPWLRINWQEFERRIKLWMENNVALVTEKEYEVIIGTLYHTPVILEQSPCSGVTETVLNGNIPLLPEVKSNTESTSETTKPLEELKTPAPIGTDPTPVPVVTPIEEKESAADKATEYVNAVKPRNLTMDAVCLAFGIKPGGYAQLMCKQLTGVKAGLKGERLEYIIDDPPMNPVEILATRDWYGTDTRYKEKGTLPKTAETIYERVLEFRAQPDYDRYMQRVMDSQTKVKPSPATEPTNELPPPNPDYAAKAEEIIQRLARGESINELATV